MNAPALLNASQSSDPAIRVDRLSKSFKVYQKPMGRIADYIWPKPGRYDEVTALDDISFSVSRGECFGIVGINGSGKSTLLKLITGTLLPTSGTIAVNGRVLALLELGGGINPELTGRQNVIVSAAMLGFPEDYAASRMGEIEAFADIGAFFDRPMRIYSSGMYVRLAFSIYLFMDPEILIVDEALSVGDIFFQQKCYEALRKIMQAGTTVLFVSHDTGAVQKLCQRALLLDHGRVEFIGLPDNTINRYYTKLGHKTEAARKDAENGAAADDIAALPDADADEVLRGNILNSGAILSAGGELALTAVRSCAPGGGPFVSQRQGTELVLDLVVEALKPLAEGDISFSLHDRFGELVFSTSSARLGKPIGKMEQGQRAIVRFVVECLVPVGEYTYRIGLTTGSDVVPSQTEMLGPILITWDKPTSRFYGQIGLPSQLLSATPQRSGQ